MAVKKQSVRLQDTSPGISKGSRIDNYWNEAGFKNFYKKFRPGNFDVPFISVDTLEKVVSKYHLSGIGFGHWVTQEDRFNYVAALIVSLHDLDKIMGFKQNVGLNGRTAIAFGARGQGPAAAHYEPGTGIINITRYSKGGTVKESSFLTGGGVGALAHEYGHAIDYYFGMYYDRNIMIASLSGGGSVDRKFEQKGGELRKAMDDVLNAIIWKDTARTTYSKFYQKLLDNVPVTKTYWYERTELFARTFEMYVQMKLAKLGIVNSFLTQKKYGGAVYPSEFDMLDIAPKITKLITIMARYIK